MSNRETSYPIVGHVEAQILLPWPTNLTSLSLKLELDVATP